MASHPRKKSRSRCAPASAPQDHLAICNLDAVATQIGHAQQRGIQITLIHHGGHARIRANAGTANRANTGAVNTGRANTGNVNSGNVNTGNVNRGNVNTGNVNINPTGTLNGGTGTLTVNGNWTNAGSFNANAGTVIFTDGCAPGPLTFSGNTMFNNLSFVSTTGQNFVLPAGATQERTLEVLKKVEQHFLETEKDSVRAIFTVAGFSFGGSGQHMGIGFVNLKHWDERTAPGQDVKSIAGRAMGAFAQIREAMVFAFVPPAVIPVRIRRMKFSAE